MEAILFEPKSQSQMTFLKDFAKQVRISYEILPAVDIDAIKQLISKGNSRVESLQTVRKAFAKVDMTDEEIRQECEIVRQQLYDKYQAR